jgi:hypothetical protein
MTRRRSIIGVVVLCTLSLCAFWAANASATGLTAFTCENKGEGHKFTDSMCETAGSGNFETVAMAANVAEEAEGDAVGTSTLQATLSLITINVTCTSAHTSGKVTNEEAAGVMKVHGTQAVTMYENCEAHLKAKTGTEEACEIENLVNGAVGAKGTIQTAALTSNTASGKVTFEEAGGGSLVQFKIINTGVTSLPCSIPTTTVSVTGTTIAKPNATKKSHITFEGEGTLKANGGAAKYLGTNVGYKKGTATATTLALEE